MRFAQAQVLAGLLKLQSEGRARPMGQDRWERLASRERKRPECA